MASTQVNPTRMELTRLKKKLATATRGHKLLKDKRDELMRQFLDLVRENMALRQKVEAGIRSANVNFVIAKAGMSEQALNTALAAPKQAVYLEADKKNVMSVDIPVFHYKTRTADENDIYSYGFAFTSSDLDGAVKSLADILPDMLRLSETEKVRTYRTRLGRAAVGRLCSCRTLLGRTLRTGRIPLIAEQLIKVLKVIRHGSVSLSTWNSSLPPTRRRNPHAPRGIR